MSKPRAESRELRANPGRRGCLIEQLRWLGTGGSRLLPLLFLLVSWLSMMATAVAPACAQISAGARLTANVRSRTATARSHAPITLVWDIRWTGMELLEGYLDIELHDGRERLGHVRNEGIVISTGNRVFETTLPVIISDNISSQFYLHVDFVTEDRRFKLGSFPLRIQAYGSRALTVALSDPWQVAFSARHSRIRESFRLERFNPKKLNSRKTDNSLTTSFSHLKPGELPASPLGYCAYNMVVLMEEGFTDLEPKQLDVLYDWVEGGGSVSVIPGGGLAERHVSFLNRLAGGDGDAPPFLLAGGGRLMSENAANRAEIRLSRPGMGRAAVVVSPAGTEHDTDSVDWRRMVAFLWNVHADLIPKLARDGDWRSIGFLTTPQPGGFGYGAGSADGNQKFQYRPISQGNWLLERLMPESVEVVPLSLIGLILAIYVIVIGPADYLLLGLIKQRKLTWILFPVVTLGVTMFTVWLSHWYMQPSEERRTVEFLDIGEEGNVARRSRFELIFTSTPRDVTTPVKGEVFASFNQQRFRQSAMEMYQQYGYYEELQVAELVGPADYSGRIPLQYTVRQEIPQWTPQINRFFSIAPNSTAPNSTAPKTGTDNFDWDGLKPQAGGPLSQRLQDSSWREDVRRRVQERFGQGASIWVMAGGHTDLITGEGTLFTRQGSNWDSPQYEFVAYPEEEMPQEVTNATNNFLTQTCAHPRAGLFSLVSRIAPSGGDNFEDLSVLDPSDENQWLLVVAVEQEGNLLIYRRLYQESPQ